MYIYGSSIISSTTLVFHITEQRQKLNEGTFPNKKKKTLVPLSFYYYYYY